MGVRLVNVLNEANFEYSERKALEDYHMLEQIAEEYEETENVDVVHEDIFVALEKLAKLKEQGIVTEEEFEAKKIELLGRI